MSKAFILVFFLFITTANAQNLKERTHWFFGFKNGITFDNGQPTFSDKSNMSALPGCASISDANGNLLFYTNGSNIYNRRHRTMENSQLRRADREFCWSMALPSSKSADQYVVISVGRYLPRIQTVDMKLGDEGLGRVTENRPFEAGRYYFGITAAKNCKDGGYWLMSLRGTSEETALVIWKMDENDEISKHSEFKLPGSGGYETYADEISISPNASRIAIPYDKGLLLLHFNANCGEVTQFQNLTSLLPFPPLKWGIWDAKFSLNNKYLYLSGHDRLDVQSSEGGKLIQVDMADPLNPENWKSRSYNTNAFPTGMQIGPDNKLYVMVAHSRYQDGDSKTALGRLDRVNNPNQPFSNMDYEASIMPLKKLFLNFSSCSFPNYFNHLEKCPDPTKPLDVSPKTFCENDEVLLNLENKGFSDSVFVIDEERGTAYRLNSKHQFVIGRKKPGIYTYKLVAIECGVRNESKLEIKVLSIPKYLPTDTILCHGDSLRLKDINGWSEEHVPHLYNTPGSLGKAGTYTVNWRVGSCKFSQQVNLSFTLPLLVDLGPSERIFCEKSNEVVRIDAGKGYYSYLWHPTQDTTQWISVRKEGDYYVVVNDSRGCTGSDGAKVISDCSPRLFVPNAFTPNNDGINDSFLVKGRYYTTDEVLIFDRWGERIFFSNEHQWRWDGRKRGELLPNGVYYLIVKYHSEFEIDTPETVVKKIHLIR